MPETVPAPETDRLPAPAPVRAAAREIVAAVVPAEDRPRMAAGRVDQRAADRRSRARAERRLLPAGWRLLAATMFAFCLVMLVATPAWPGPIALLCCALAMLAVMVGPFISRIDERMFPPMEGPSRWRIVAVASTIGIPMFLYGFGVGHWPTGRGAGPAVGTLAGSGGVSLPVAVIAMAGMVACIILGGRLFSCAVATASLWCGAASQSGSLAGLLLIMAGGAAALALALREARGDVARALAVAQADRERHRAEAMLAEYEATGQGWFWETDRRGILTYISPQIADLFGSAAPALRGRAFTELFVLSQQERESERTLVFHLATRSSFQDLPIRAATGEDEERWWSITGRPVLDHFDNFMGFRGSGTDLTETRRSQRHVTELARFDSLTKLANRFQMGEWLEKILAAPREDNRVCAVFLLDLDRFKQVNDTMGHPAGDALLCQVADRLRTTVGNDGRVGRLGGDEFQVILPGRQVHEALANLAQRIIDSLSQPYSIEGARVVIGASLGIARYPDDGLTAEALIRNADLALYAAKDGGRGRHHFYAEDLHADAKERQLLEQDLRDAIATGGFELHYQPQVRTTTETITGFEALLRWNHPRLGYLSPARFIPIAEETGLIAPIGEWALRTACADLARWPEDVRVAVNVSPIQFANSALPAIVTGAIAAAQVAAGRLELEITESVFLGDDQASEAMFAALKRVGVRLALDDFGTGYSALGYLKKAPFDKIKIDQSFVRGATGEGTRNRAIIASIVSLADALGMETTAEGVETLDELDLVRQLGCSHVQGFIYERPLPAADADARLSQGLVAVARGPRSARAPRRTMLRKVQLEHGGHLYDATIRNLSQTGALVEGLWNVPAGTRFALRLAPGQRVEAVASWCREDRMGVAFTHPLDPASTRLR